MTAIALLASLSPALAVEDTRPGAPRAAPDTITLDDYDRIKSPGDLRLGRDDRLSPLLRAGQVQTPTLFIGGRDDWNVPILNAELFYQSLRKRGIDTQRVVYPGMHHGDWTDEFQKDFLSRHLQWFDHYLGASPAPTGDH